LTDNARAVIRVSAKPTCAIHLRINRCTVGIGEVPSMEIRICSSPAGVFPFRLRGQAISALYKTIIAENQAFVCPFVLLDLPARDRA
jgi:hypothetical protein